MLDVWGDMTDPPQLLICGARGWNNDAVFDRLDRLDRNGPIRELPGLSDRQVAAILQGARALLFPSRAEGFGLPRPRPRRWACRWSAAICPRFAKSWARSRFTCRKQTVIYGKTR
ncbi:hypothetical protein [Jhaorihella thermophila]|uniref:hypothetical protein n=1 Tax=Jhaorihella thermophila TaxID=488547 RepID=UPI00360FE047